VITLTRAFRYAVPMLVQAPAIRGAELLAGVMHRRLAAASDDITSPTNTDITVFRYSIRGPSTSTIVILSSQILFGALSQASLVHDVCCGKHNLEAEHQEDEQLDVRTFGREH
jgi:hypothetical protein